MAQQSRPVGDLCGVGDQHAGIPEGAQVLPRIEAEGRGLAEAAGSPAAQECAVRLAGILDHRDTGPP